MPQGRLRNPSYALSKYGRLVPVSDRGARRQRVPILPLTLICQEIADSYTHIRWVETTLERHSLMPTVPKLVSEDWRKYYWATSWCWPTIGSGIVWMQRRGRLTTDCHHTEIQKGEPIANGIINGFTVPVPHALPPQHDTHYDDY